MKNDDKRILRRTFLKGVASSAGAMLAGCSDSGPPTYGNLLRMGDNLTYRAHRLLLPEHSLAREYDLGDITSVPAIGTTNPASPDKTSYSEQHGPEAHALQDANNASHLRRRLVGHRAVDGRAATLPAGGRRR